MSSTPTHPAGVDFVSCPALDQARQQLRDFLRQPVAGGGMLLVVGPRGVGKSRLVDEALNDREHRPGWLARLHHTLFGEPECSTRLLLKRAPRGVERLILPVPISPFALLDSADQPDARSASPAAVGGDPSSAPGPATHADPAGAVLRNLVFGLTNAIDPHLSTRRYGRTLYQRLGWRDFWFSRTGLLLHAPSSGRGVLVLVLLWILLFLTVLLEVWVEINQPEFRALLGSGLGIAAVQFGVAALGLGWLLLRWLDWRGLLRFNDLLYNLIRSDRSALKTREDDTQSRGVKLGSDPFMQIAGYVALISGALGLLATWSPNWLPDWLRPMADGNAPSLASLVLTAAGLVLLITGRAQHRSAASLESSFSAHNPAWTVNLLRRYLYLLHRCGLEPVLVVDELDKLETMPVSREANRPQRQPATPDVAADPTRLDAFTRALERLKDSLGTEFLWVLIGGPTLWLRLRDERLQTLPGPLATVITRTLVIGPSHWSDADAYLRHFVSGSCDAQQARRQIAWLRGRGHFALMAGEVQGVPETPDDDDQQHAKRLRDWVGSVWEPTHWHTYGAVGGEPPPFPVWRQVWIRVGILDLAAQLLREPAGAWRTDPLWGTANARELLDMDNQEGLTLRYPRINPI